MTPHNKVSKPSVPSNGCRFLADTMATGLCKELRRFGFDCQLLQPNGDREVEWKYLVETAYRETRVILTRHSGT